MAGRQLAETHVDSTTALPQELPLHERGRSTPNTPSGSPIPGSSNSPPHSAWKKWIGNGVLDGILEDESLLCEFVGAPVCEGGVESLVVGPPHIVVGVGA